MIECTFDQILRECAKRECEEFADAPEFITSKRHDRAMKRIFKRYERNVKKLAQRSDIRIRNVRRRVTVVVLVIIFAVLSGCAAAYFISQSFRGEVHSDNTELFPINLDNCPTVIEEKYYLSELFEGFEISYTSSTPFHETVSYINEQTGKKINFGQYVKSVFGSTHYNTEKGKLIEVEINGNSGVFLDLSKDQNLIYVLWDNGDYILELSGNLTKNDVLNLAKSAKV